MTNEALDLVNKILEPKRLSYLQELVFLQSWEGKLYREIAISAGYDFDYIKEVGSELWKLLSDALGARVTKKNLKLVLAKYYGTENPQPLTSTDTTIASDWLKFPSQSVPLNSPLYISRPPLEERAYQEVERSGSLIRIRAPRQMGKTSLLLRVLSHARQSGLQTVMLNLQQADNRIFNDANRFFRWFCVYVTHELGLEVKLADYWDDDIGSKVSCTIYFQEYLLPNLNTPLVLAIDEINRVFEYPDLVQEFLPLLRTWHESSTETQWQKLRLILVHSTEVYVPLKLSQSPFNVGLLLQVPEFSRSQINELGERYNLTEVGIQPADLDPLYQLIGGHPYLMRLAFYALYHRETTLPQLLETAATQASIYSNHLRQHLSTLQQHPDLLVAFRQVVQSPGHVQLQAIIAYQLESMGLIRLKGNEAIVSCELYHQYFRSQLSSPMEMSAGLSY